MKTNAAVFTLIVLLSYSAFAQKGRVPAFGNYPARVETARAKKINFRGDRANRTFRTRLSESLRDGVNFAGHFIVAGWGCGTGCFSGAIIDGRNGNVFWPKELGGVSVWFGETDYTEDSVAFRKNSRLLVIHGTPGNSGEFADDSKQGTYFYEWKNNRLRLLRFVRQVSN